MSLKLCKKCKTLYVDFALKENMLNLCEECKFQELLKENYNKQNLKEVK